MLIIKVKYFLNDAGLNYFPDWYEEVLRETSKQDGYINMNLEMEGDNPIVYLCFESEAKLDLWVAQKTHDELATKIETYFDKPQEVEIK